MLVDPATEEVVGVQVEDVLTRAIVEHLIVLDALSVAELRGISPTEIARLRSHRSPGEAPDFEPSVAVTENRERRKREIVAAFLRDRSPFGASFRQA